MGRHSMRRGALLPLVLLWLGTACSTPSSSTTSTPAASGPSQPSRVLVAAIHTEPKIIAAVGPGLNASVSLGLSKRMFNADLALLDEQGRPLPYLAETLP